MEFFRRARREPRAIGVLPGAFNPPTRAHMALASAALGVVEEVVFVLPRVFPHKEWQGAGFEDRVRLLEAATARNGSYSIAASDRGLFIEIARECREAYGAAVEVYVLCGRDAAERIVNWDYGTPGAIEQQLREFQLLVAPRNGVYEPPAHLAPRIHPLLIGQDYNEISASEVRSRIEGGEPWECMVPPEIVEQIRRLY